MKEDKSVTGYVVMTDTLGGWVLCWKNYDGKEYEPQWFRTIDEAYKEIGKDIDEDIQQCIDGEREPDEIHRFSEYIVCEYELYQGMITVRSLEGEVMLKQSLKEWREAQ